MRALLAFIIFVIILAGACNTTQSGTRASDKVKSQDTLTGTATLDTITIENDELEYEIIILEIGFNQWLVSQPPMNYWSLNVLEQRNRAYVFEWNQRAANPTAWNPNLYNQFIDYDPTIRYGLEVNYMLYMYFEFFQQKYRQRL